MKYTALQYAGTVAVLSAAYLVVVFRFVPRLFALDQRPFSASCAGAVLAVCLSASSALYLVAKLDAIQQRLA